MPEPVDFNGLMADVQKMQQFLAQIHGSLSQPRQKQVLGELMGRIEQARADVESSYPAAVKTIRESAERTQREATQMKEELAARSQELASLDATRAAPPPPKAVSRRPKTKLRPELSIERGSLLRKELLQRFGGAPTQKTDRHDREIWEDWNWE